jgi:uncharacterized protein (TIGR02453 family)
MTGTAFPAEGLTFLARLGRNNSTEWFHAHRDEYRALVQDPMVAIVEEVNDALKDFAPAYVITKKNLVSRPNRDTRFSKDKSPYRTDIAAVFPRQGLEKHQAAGFFFRVDEEGAELVAGTYVPGPDELRALRRHLSEHHAAFLRITNAKALRSAFGELQGEKLARVPAGFAADHPAAELLRMKQFYVRATLPAKVVTSARFASELTTAFRAATPFVEAIDRALGNM